MSGVAVITGGAGGMGLETAKVMARAHDLVLADNRQDRLAAAVATLSDLGVRATAVDCDVTDRAAVAGLFETAAGIGRIASVIHTAGVSPSMGDAEYVARTNALGTLYVNEVFFATAIEGSAIVNVASMAAHLITDDLISPDTFALAPTDEAAFLDGLRAAYQLFPEEARSGVSYAVSKGFVKWYSSAQSERFNSRGLRIVSVSPGSIDTEMGRLEEKAGAGAMVADAAVPRWGKPEEMAELFAFCVSDRAGYLTGTDILNDGGVVASIRERARAANRTA